MNKHRIKIKYTCSDFCNHEHKYKWTACLCGRIQYTIFLLFRYKLIIIPIFIVFSLSVLFMSHPYLERLNMCDPSTHSTMALLCYAELKRPKGSPRPYCDTLKSLQLMCKDNNVYIVTPFFSEEYLQKVKK